MKTLDDTHTGSPAAMSMADRWLSTCCTKHTCGAKKATYTPTRLVEILPGQTLRLVRAEGAAYVALSHRWGFQQLPTTTTKNVSKRKQGFLRNSLTPTVKDAISVVQSLGFSYLWIDALCILQDSDEDWLHEASEMSKVFNNAVLTLAAADGDEHSQGMFRHRPENKFLSLIHI